MTTERPQLAKPGETPAQPKPIDIIRKDLDRMSNEFAVALPQHIPVDRFKRVLITAINQNNDLLAADRKALLGASMKCAQDGLYPDGKEGALVVYKTKVKQKNAHGNEVEVHIKAVQWMPMVYGIIKKMRNSGELSSITAHEVYEKDNFTYVLGDEERIEHRPYMGTDDPGQIVGAYAIARLKDGTVQRDFMNRRRIDRVRAASKSPDSPAWRNWFDEMAKKAVVRRLSKYLPTSTEVEETLRRDDALAASDNTVENGGTPGSGDNFSGVTIEHEAAGVDEALGDAEIGRIEDGSAETAGAGVTITDSGDAHDEDGVVIEQGSQAKAEPEKKTADDAAPLPMTGKLAGEGRRRLGAKP
jgi:recombination protein RecT